MLRVEIFILLGFILGFPLGVLSSHLTRKYLAWRDSRIRRVRVSDSLNEAQTADLLEELSTREDLNNPKEKKRNA